MLKTILVASIYALAIGLAFCAVTAYLALVWKMLKRPQNEDQGSPSEGKWR